VILVALTGGIGSGKSTVSEALAARGAVVVDADVVTRDVQAPGQPVLAAIVERFGAGVLQPDGQLDRAALAAQVFGDAAALGDLNAIVHPAVGVEMWRRVEEHRGSDRVVVLDIPLLAESTRGRYAVAGVVVVDVPEEIAVERLVKFRGMTVDDAQARISRQASRAERLAIADRVIDNSGDRAALERQVNEAWEWIATLPHAEPPPSS
jgi:dephospho-CoA kinase